ncbi:uncharacterized protein LOC117009751 [Catharus ustulatus]|uniref:uncharacterized protein LOC117009751 n=1 Tax=Catharus ustulatus TaxID=91951 RepID=UPI001407E1B3|nr:uncharacterized protein LOC117009751 [Catharus ustulatus]
MGSSMSRTVEIRISNRTQNITLRNPRTYESGFCTRSPRSELRPSSTDTSHFVNSGRFCGIAGILVYEADSFTLAIYFSNPFDYNMYSIELGLELSLSKAHVGSLAEIYARMSKGTYSSSFVDAEFNRVIVEENQGIAWLNKGPIKVMATMSNTRNSTLKVMLEDQGGLNEEANMETHRNAAMRSENLQDPLWDLLVSPGTLKTLKHP